jgi:tetratricopeptide (TPR) repeat protein
VPARTLRILACGLWLALASPAWSTNADSGTESNLDLGAGSRGIALGGAFLARVGDASAVYWNPAGLVGLERAAVTIMHAPIGFGDASQTFFGVAYPTLGAGSFGLGFMRLGTDGIDAYDADSNPLGSLEFSESSFYLSYAARPDLPHLGRALSLGVTAKTLTQSLTPWSSTSAGLDLGCVVQMPRFPALGLAVVWQDAVAPHPRLDQESDPIPSLLHLAGSYRFAPSPMLGLDVHLGVDHGSALGWSPRLGVEATYRGHLHLRAGASRYGAAFGVGVGWQSFGLDYTYLSRNDAATHPVSLDAGWGRSLPQRLAAREQAREALVRSHLQAMLDAKLASAQAAYDRGDYATALDEWKAVAGLDPSEVRVQKGIEAASARLAELQSRSLADQGQAAARAAQFELGLRYYGDSEYVLACNVWKALLETNPEDAEAARYLTKSETALREQVRQQAEQARAAEASGDWVAALAAWTRVRLADSRHPEAGAGLARCRDRLERPQPARTASRSDTGIAAPRASEAAAPYKQALALYAAGDLNGAVTQLREVLRLDSDHRAAADLLAKAERQLRPLGDEDRARVRDLYLRGMGYFTANDFDRAIEEWSKILVLDPGNTSVYQNIREAKARQSAMHR